MSLFSKSEREIMNSSFVKLFKVDRSLLATDALKEWIESAAKGLVEYDGRLKGEKEKDRDYRMELYEIYDGQIAGLVNHLRQKRPEYRSLTKWELIFKVYNEIMDVQKVIERAESQYLNPTVEEDVTEEVIETSTSDNTPIAVEKSSSESDEICSEEQSIETGSTEEDFASEENIQTSALSDPMPSGNAEKLDEQTLLNNYSIKENNTNQEETKMNSELNKLINAANNADPNGGSTSADPTKAQTAPTSANISGVSKEELKAAQVQVSTTMGDTVAARAAYTRSNFVTAIISVQKPAALRVKDTMGVVTDETDAEKIKTAITEKVNKFIVGVSGQADMTIDKFESLSDADRYANIVKPEQMGKAAAMYEVLKQMFQNPTGKFKAHVDPSKVTYPTKGYVLGGKNMTVDEFLVEAIDKSTGVIYAEGSCDANGNDIGDKPVTFKVGLATKRESAATSGIAANTKSVKVTVIRPKNKKEFLADPNNVVFLFTKESEAEVGKASFKAAVTVNGVEENATLSVWALGPDGKKVQKGTDKDNNPTYKTKLVSIAVSVPVAKIVKEFAAEFQTGDDVVVTAAKWGINMSVSTQDGNFGNIKELSQAPIFDVFANAYAGNVKISGVLGKSESLNALKAAANQSAQEEAAATQDELAE